MEDRKTQDVTVWHCNGGVENETGRGQVLRHGP